MQNPEWRSARQGEVGGLSSDAGADALQRGVARLRFPEPLEAAFRRLRLSRYRARVRFWQPFLIATGLIYGVSRLHHSALGGAASSFEVALRFGVLLPAWSVLAGLAWSRHYAQWYPRIARILVPVTGCLFAALMTLRMASGRGEALSALATHMLGLMLLSGLLFRQAIWTCGAMLLMFVAVALYEASSLAKLFFDLLSPLTTAAVAGFVCYESEKASRQSFLDHQVAADRAASDPLTGLKNRRTFDEQLQGLWGHALRENGRLGLLLVDADEFKRYNDRYGHQAGDLCLRKIAQAVQRAAQRPLDLAARFGGEEFAVLLHEVNSDQIKSIAERLRAAVEALAIEHLGSTVARVVTVSIGAASVRAEPGRHCEGLVQLADEALYDAKRGGRNRMVERDEEYAALNTGEFRHPTLSAEGSATDLDGGDSIS